jgi:EF hand
MLRFFAGVVSTLLLIAAGFFIWRSQAEQDDPVPAAPDQAALVTPLRQGRVPEPPASSEQAREEKRFARADLDDDGRITREELMSPRRRAFARLDANGDGRLAFEEWAVKTEEKFAGADADKSGWLTAAEFEKTKVKTRPSPRCRC